VCKHRGFGCSPADVNNHASSGFVYMKIGSYRGGKRGCYKRNAFCSRLKGCVLKGALLNVRNAEGNAYHYLGAVKKGVAGGALCHFQKAVKHIGGNIEIRDNAVAKRQVSPY